MVSRLSLGAISRNLTDYFLHVASRPEKCRTALHVAAANDDVDGVCRLLEWGAALGELLKAIVFYKNNSQAAYSGD